MPAIPFVKDIHFTPGTPDLLRPGVRRVIANNPGPFTYTGSGTYIIGTGDVAVIDPGPDDDEHLAALLKTLDAEKVTHILVTHTHRDHCALARKFADATGAPIFGFGAHPVKDLKIDAPALDEGADYNYAPDELIAHGEVLTGNDWSLEVVHTPGHLSNHLCFSMPAEKALFTGDHIMGWATTVVAPPDGDMNAYLESLAILLKRDDEVYFPTHGAPIDNPKRFVRAVRTHRLMRDAQIIDQIKNGRTRIKEIVTAMYADVDKRLHGAAALNVLAHLIRLEKNGVVKCDGEPGMKSEYRPAE
ncbi:MBL fold metallo-hydrolase [Hyphococcus sp. DH-69]|uniref:MBL fold metallo-hydrolase n=1 Tax=Hyphococcus formosus TaxID=3143534 RepID=UPI00398AB946